MQRLRTGFLVQGADGRLRHGQARFSGVAYRMGRDGTLDALVAVDEGVPVGASTDWLALPEDGLRVDSAALELPGDYGPRLYQGRPFTGLAYTFTRTGYCTSEVEYAGGFATEVCERRWYVTGQPRVHVDGGEYTAWFPDGRIQHRGCRGELVYGLITRDDGHLRELVLRDARFLDLGLLCTLTLTDAFQLLGAGVDTALLRTLQARTGLGGIRTLRLVQTRLGADGVDVLATFANLQEVWFDGNPGLGAREARRLEQLRPGCVAHFVEADAPAPIRRARGMTAVSSGHAARLRD